MNILDRYKKPTPKFFRIIRNIGIALATIGGAILTSPISLPEILFTLSAYITIAGTVASAISQAVVGIENSKDVTEKPTNHEL